MNAEQIREARRLKILANAEKRIQLITGQSNSSNPEKISPSWDKPNVETDPFSAQLPATSSTSDSTITRTEIRQRNVNPLPNDEASSFGTADRARIDSFMNFDDFEGANKLNSLHRDSVSPTITSKPVVEPTEELKSISILHHRFALVFTAIVAFLVLMSDFAPFVMKSAWVPFILVEMYLQLRMPFTEPKGSLLFTALMMSGLPQSTTSHLKKALSIAQRCGVDLAFYLFTFVTLYALTTVFQ